VVITQPTRSSSEDDSAVMVPAAEVQMAGRRRLLKWLIGAASAAFVASFGLPAVALKSLSMPRTGVQKGDMLVLATGMPGVPAGRPMKLADLPVGPPIYSLAGHSPRSAACRACTRSTS
jgi:hypothetical protein